METVKKVTQDHPEVVNLVHIGLVAPLLGFAGLQLKNTAEGKPTSPHIGKLGLALIIIAVIILVFHGLQAYNKMSTHHGAAGAKPAVTAAVVAAANATAAKEGYMRGSR